MGRVKRAALLLALLCGASATAMADSPSDRIIAAVGRGVKGYNELRALWRDHGPAILANVDEAARIGIVFGRAAAAGKKRVKNGPASYYVYLALHCKRSIESSGPRLSPSRGCKLAQIYLLASAAYFNIGGPTTALSLLRRGIPLFRKLAGPGGGCDLAARIDLIRAGQQAACAHMAAIAGEPPEGLAFFEETLVALRTVGKEARPDAATVSAWLGLISGQLWMLGDLLDNQRSEIADKVCRSSVASLEILTSAEKELGSSLDLILGTSPAIAAGATALLRHHRPEPAKNLHRWLITYAGAVLGSEVEGRSLDGCLKHVRLLRSVARAFRKKKQPAMAGVVDEWSLRLVEILTATDAAPAAAILSMGRLYRDTARLHPEDCVARLERALSALETYRRMSGASATLWLEIGDTYRVLARYLASRLEEAPKDRGIWRDLGSARVNAIGAYEKGIKLDGECWSLSTGYNECLWAHLAHTGGRFRKKPVMVSWSPYCLAERDYGVGICTPRSRLWNVSKNTEDNLLYATKPGGEGAQDLTLWIRSWRWDMEYVLLPSGGRIGGENLTGLARVNEQATRRFFRKITKQSPPRKITLNRYTRKACILTVEGITHDGLAVQRQEYYFKAREGFTYQVVVIANMATLAAGRHEVKAIMETVRANR